MKSPEYIRYTDREFRTEFLSDMERDCQIPGAEDGHLRVSYDPARYDFRSLIAEEFLEKGILQNRSHVDAVSANFESLHQYVAPEEQILDNTQHNAAAVALYGIRKSFLELYVEFLKDVIAPALGMGGLHWQKHPTFRVFFPESKGYPGKTTYHSDIMLGHNPREINVFLPLTSCEGSRSLLMGPLGQSLELLSDCKYDFTSFAEHVQTNEDTQKPLASMCKPLVMGVGEVLIFDSRCLHAGPPNLTDKSRLTVDFRLLAKDDIENQQNQYRGTGRTKALFAPSGAFTEDTL